jgi:DNA-binding LytR/AlgR family response regulator
MTRIKIQHKRQKAAADTIAAFNISDHDWDATPMKVRQLLNKLRTEPPAPVIVTVTGGVAEALSAPNQTVVIYDFDNDPDMEEKFEAEIEKHTKKYNLT